MLLLVIIIIACIPSQAIMNNILPPGRNHEDDSENIRKNLNSNNYWNTDKHMKTHRNCTSLDVYCLPICCKPDPHHNRWACYANSTFSLMRDINFLGKNECNFSALNINPEELNDHWKDYNEFDYKSQHEIWFYLLGNGTLYENYSTTDDLDNWLDVNDYYCLASGVTEDRRKHFDAICFSPPEQKFPGIEIHIIYVISSILALPFLAATFVAYTILPKVKSVHGLTIRAYVASLSVMFISLIIPTVSKRQLCSVLVYVTYFSSMSCFAWVNVMSFDIWQTFRKYRSMQINKRQSTQRKFIIYSFFAWGGATIFTGIIGFMDTVPYVPHYFIKPQLGMKDCCVFGSLTARAIYMYLPTGISLLVNVFLFASSMKTIRKQTKEITYYIEGPNSCCHSEHRERFNFTAKLSTMMFINWLMEIINCLCEHDSLLYFWALMDLTNVLQGFTVFVIFVWTDKTKLHLFKYLGLLEEKIDDENTRMRNNDVTNNNEPEIRIKRY